MSSEIRVIPPQGDSGPSFLQVLYSALTGGWEEALHSVANRDPKFSPPDVLPCANVNVEKYAACEQPGKLACGSCKLVSYCSKECQKAHWATHKSDCKDPIRSSDWRPGWITERREPNFIDRSNASPMEEFVNRFQDRLSLGVSLWGNVPAMDIVNLPNNEKNLNTDLSLAYAASGDLRNIVVTVNALGSDFSGQLNILLNDLNPHVVSRNIALLLILGTIPDEVTAADIALHFWYSVFMPMEYRLRILSMVSTFLKEGESAGPTVVPLGSHSTLICQVTPEVRRLLMQNAGPSISVDQAQTEYGRVRKAPSRADFRDRMYMGLKPSHRLAFLEYRRFGVVLPFGALNAHCNVPNPSLFSNGVWLQTDYADPLESWDVDKVFSAGKAHGAQPEDVYGCLYFFLSDQLRAFARRIRQHRISFRVFNSEACALAQGIAHGEFAKYGVASASRFNRIDVSNIMDPNYVGIRAVVDAWGPLLAKTNHAALIGYFMNWAALEGSGRAADAGPSAVRNALKLLADSNRIRPDGDPMITTFLALKSINALHDTSIAFAKFWRDYGGAHAKLQLKSSHKIVPHRLKTAVGAKPDALPDFADNEMWYRYTQLINLTWTERFVELGHKKYPKYLRVVPAIYIECRKLQSLDDRYWVECFHSYVRPEFQCLVLADSFTGKTRFIPQEEVEDHDGLELSLTALMTANSVTLSSSEEHMFASLIKSNDPLGLLSASDCEALGDAIGGTLMPLTFPPLEALPCANNCLSPGTLPCARCKLVSYCSQKCQRTHKSVHKRSCGVPSFPDATSSRDDNQYSLRTSPLRGETTPISAPPPNLLAVDVINLKNNEKDKSRDFSLAFAASGDLRNVVRTVNALGPDYAGRLHVLLNDTSTTTVSHNIVLLLILGAMPNEAVAADIALHFWYSVFLPEEYRLRILASLVLILQQYADKTEPLSVNLGLRARLTCLVPREITDHLLYTAGPALSTSRARDEYERVCATPARLHAKNRALAGVKPCHSLGFMAFWRSGVVLPFSVNSEHYTAPNAAFFSPFGTWLSNNVDSPLTSWDLNEVIKTGQEHGAQPEDVYGCLYFFLTDQLQNFARRIRELDVSFYVFNTTAYTLAQDITRGQYSPYGLTPSVRFDRVDLGHTLGDSGCMREVLRSWEPLLAEGSASTILGVFSDWTNTQMDGSVVGANETAVAPIIDKLIKLGRLPPGTTLASAIAAETTQLDAAYDNSKAFSKFLKTGSLGDVLRGTTLKRRLRHKILPQRIRAPIDAKASDLPHIPDDETWYRYVWLAKTSFTARYVEFARTTG